MQHPPWTGRRAVATLAFALTVLLAPSAGAGLGTGHPTASPDRDTLRRHWQASATSYSLLTQLEPENGLAWFRLGTALEQTADPAGAVDAFTRAEALGYEPIASRYHLAVNHALLGKQETARDWLRRARATDREAEQEGTLLDTILGDLGAGPRVERLLGRVERPVTSVERSFNPCL